MKKILVYVCLIACSLPSYAQLDTTKTKVKKLEHHIGVQVNELLRQVLNLNNSGSNITNPYLLTYNITHIKSGLGLRLGGGYNLQKFANDDGITKRSTDINVLNVRFGIEKVFKLSGRWTTGVGIDGLYSTNNNNTETSIRSFDTTTTKTNSKIVSIGGGAMCWLRYTVTKNIVIGTEASFYYTGSKQTQDVEITKRTNTFPNVYKTSISTLDNKNKEGLLSLPVVIYLFIKF